MGFIDDVKFIAKDFSENPDEVIEVFKGVWNEADPEDKAYIQTILLLIPLRWYAKHYWLRKGAPEWAARGFASLGSAIAIAPARHAFEQRQRERKAKATTKPKSAASVFN
jgi:hypothetical protein